MKVNERTIIRIVNVLENSAMPAFNVRIMPDTGESDYIIRFEDGNSITISIYFSIQFEQISCSIGFLDREERYKTFSTWVRLERTSEQCFFFELYDILHRCSEFAVDNFF